MKCPSTPFHFCITPRISLFLRRYETPERTIFDDSGMGYTDSHIDSRLECSETQSGGTSCIQMKTEPLGGPSSPESTSETNAHPDDCAGCGRSIQVSQVGTETVVALCRLIRFIWIRLIRFFPFLPFTRIDSTFRQLKSDGMLGACSVVCAGSYSKAKRHAFHVMEVFIANQTTTGKPNVQGTIFI